VRAPAAADYWLGTTGRELQQQQDYAAAAAAAESAAVEGHLLLLEGLHSSLQPLTELANSSSSSEVLQHLAQSVQQLHGVLGQLQQNLPADRMAALRMGLRRVHQQQLPRLASHPAAVEYWLQTVKSITPQVRVST
jgi:hypothetical protein